MLSPDNVLLFAPACPVPIRADDMKSRGPRMRQISHSHVHRTRGGERGAQRETPTRPDPGTRQLAARGEYEQPVSLPCGGALPSSLSITHSRVSVSAGLRLAPNEQTTALSVSQCYGNKICQSLQKKHQSATGMETSFKRSREAVEPRGKLTYWILLTAWYL